MSVQHLPASAYVACQGYDDSTQGVNATHTALVKFNKSEPAQLAYVKFCHDPYQLLAEVICYIIASHLQILQPVAAAVITVPVKMLQQSGVPVPPAIAGDKLALAWCTQALGAKSIKAIFNIEALALEGLVKLYKNSTSAVAAISAFDELVANHDRNLGNVIQLSANTIAVIDHGLCLNYSLLANKDIHVRNIISEVLCNYLNTQQYDIFKSKSVLSAASHASAVSRGQADITLWMQKFSADSLFISQLIDFLLYRSEESWLANHLDII